MKIRQFIPVSGSWYVMLRHEDSPECCSPVAIAVWAFVEWDENTSGVHPMIPSNDATSELEIPSGADVVGICNEEGTRDPNWQDRAKASHVLELEAEKREENTWEALAAAIDRVTGKLERAYREPWPARTFHNLLADIDRGQVFMFRAETFHALREDDFITPIEGGWKLLPRGREALMRWSPVDGEFVKGNRAVP